MHRIFNLSVAIAVVVVTPYQKNYQFVIFICFHSYNLWILLEIALHLMCWLIVFQLSLMSLSFNALTAPDKKNGLSCLQSACINGDIETVNTILNYSPDKLDSAIAVSLKIGSNSTYFPGKSLLSVLRMQDSEKHKRIKELVEKLTGHFKSESLLHLAARRGHTEHIRRLLDFGEYVDLVSLDLSGNGETPLMLAARFNGVEVVEFLAERGASLEMKDNNGFTPIHHASIGGKPANILRMIELGADVLTVCDGKTAIHIAAENGHSEAVRVLLEHGADANGDDGGDGMTPLLLAAQNGHLETFKVLFENGGDLNRCDLFNNLPLHYAAKGDHIDTVKFILQKGGNVLAKTGEGEAVLHLATCLELVSFLVDEGADIHARDCLDRTALHSAAEKGHTDTVIYLLNQGVDVNSCDGIGRSALYYAVRAGHAATAKVLIDRGYNLEMENDYFVDLLQSAAQRGLTDILRLLFDIGLGVDTVTSRGQTLLMVAAEAGQRDTVIFLLDRGANINFRNAEEAGEQDYEYVAVTEEKEEEFQRLARMQGSTPLYYALKAGQSDVAKLLIERGADTTNINAGYSLQALAAKHGFYDILELLSGTDQVYFENLDDGNTLLISAAGRGDLKSVRFLLQKGVSVNAKNMSGDTALSSAVKSAVSPVAIKIVQLLIAFGADINARNHKSKTPLQIACDNNFYQAAEMLIELGCEAKTKDIDNNSPLHSAARNNNGKLTEVLLQYGADVSLKSDEGEVTPLHLAARNASVHAAQVLLDHAVDVELTNTLGRTPLAEAAAVGSLPMVQLLLRNGGNVQAKDKSGKTPLILAVKDMLYGKPWSKHC